MPRHAMTLAVVSKRTESVAAVGPAGKSASQNDPKGPKKAGDENAPGQQSAHRQPYYEHQVQFKRDVILSSGKQKALEHVLSHYDIPPDFTVDKALFGPLGGQSYSQRVLTAYAAGLLKPKTGAAGGQGGAGAPSREVAAAGGTVLQEVCIECGEEGHRAKACPAAF